MPELRKDPVIGRWIIIAAERSRRPHRFKEPEAIGLSPDSCPFCPGHEHETPSELLSYRSKDTLPNEPGWWTRVVPNKFPALKNEGSVKRVGMGMYDMVSGIGAHEVVIESPNHYGSFGVYDVHHAEEVIWAYRDRILDLKQDPRLQYILIFKNHGSEAGASLDHPHSQIIALPIIPKRVQEELEGAKRYWDYKERCVFCDIIHQECLERERIIEENEHFVALLPFASRFPYETWILPKKHSLHFHDIQKTEVHCLAEALHNSLARLRLILNDPPYNFMIHTSPLNKPPDCYHWHIEIIPKMTKVAGFEWGTGFYINPLPPEQAARFMAEVEPEKPNVVPLTAASGEMADESAGA